jgi:hypothetical protein
MHDLKHPRWCNYLMSVEKDFYPELPEMSIEGIVYSPGLVCTYCNTSLKLGFVVRNNLDTNIYGGECLKHEGVAQWRLLASRVRYYQMYDHFRFEEDLNSAQKGLMRRLSLLTQVMPWAKFPQAMLAHMLNQQAMNAKQAEVIKRMTEEQGGLDVLLRWRDALRRLSLLVRSHEFGSANLEEKKKTFSLFQQGQRKPLSTAQERLLYALEENRLEARIQLSRTVLEQWPFENGKMDWSKVKQGASDGYRF